MRNSLLLCFSLGLLAASCQGEDKTTQTSPATSSPQPHEAAASAEPTSTPQSSTPPLPSKVTSKPLDPFYKITIAKPAAVCGPEGFAYAWKAYLVPECGGCHYAGNQFKITPFAQSGNVDASYQIMADQVDRTKLLAATETNQFCIKCILRSDDPLLADLKYLMQNLKTCPVQTTFQ